MSRSGSMPAGDAVGRLVITLSLTACMGGIAAAATLQSSLFPRPSPVGIAAENPLILLADTRISDNIPVNDVIQSGRFGFAAADFAGQVLPLPAIEGASPVAVDDPQHAFGSAEAVAPSGNARHETTALADAATAGVATSLPSMAAASASSPSEDVTQSRDTGEAIGWSTTGWFATPAAPEQTPVVEAEHLVVQRGDTLLQILMRSGIDRAEAHEVVGTLSTLYDPRRLRVGQAMAVEVERAGNALAAPRLAALSLNLDFGNDLRVERDANGDFAARKVDRELVQSVHAAYAVIETSLYQTARRHAVPDEALVNLANIFSWDLDFQRDVHAGDSFEIVYEQVESPDGEIRGGEVLFASLKLRGRQVHAYRYEHSDGTAGYYDTDGRSLRKWLMRTPIDGARLSSGFGPRRHPILGYNRMHRGVDFAAATGTPIYAAGDGEISKIGRNGAYGNYIQIRHSDEFSTAYAHMSRFADSLKNGSRVRQGQVIAYVGSTGRSTGPHLHYEVLQDGQQINPMSIKPQTAARLTGADLERFRRQIETIDAKRPAVGTATALAQR